MNRLRLESTELDMVDKVLEGMVPSKVVYFALYIGNSHELPGEGYTRRAYLEC